MNKRTITIVLAAAATFSTALYYIGAPSVVVIIGAVLIAFAAMAERSYEKELEDKTLQERVRKWNLVLDQQDKERRMQKSHADFIHESMRRKFESGEY